VEEVFCCFFLSVAGAEGVFWELGPREVGEEGHVPERDGEGGEGVEERTGRPSKWECMWTWTWTWEEINTPSP
jgi:hypothetical protein